MRILIIVLLLVGCKTPPSLSNAVDVTVNRGDQSKDISDKTIRLTARNRSFIVFIFTRDTTIVPLVESLDSLILRGIKKYNDDKLEEKSNDNEGDP